MAPYLIVDCDDLTALGNDATGRHGVNQGLTRFGKTPAGSVPAGNIFSQPDSKITRNAYNCTS